MLFRFVVIALITAGMAFTPLAHAQVQPTAPASGGVEDNPAGHGSVSVSYINTLEHDVWGKPYLKRNPFGTVRLQGLGLDGSYNVADNWTIYGSIRYVDNVAKPISGPEQRVSDWTDATLGAAWHTLFNGYEITTSATTNIPVNDYTTIGGAYAGQHLQQLLLDVSLAHQFDFTNIYYRLGYGYAFSQKVRGFDTGYQRYDAELGWFANERFSVRGFLTGRGGFGLTGFEYQQALAAGKITASDRARTAEHSYRAFGLGTDYDFGSNWLASLSVQHAYWGATVFDAKYALEARLTRSF